MLSKDQIQAVRGGTAVDSSGSKIGGIGEVYLDDQTGQPAWLTINTGLFGTSESFVPLQEATVEGDQVTLPYSKDQVKDAPRVDADQHLDVEQERELYRHYGLDYDAAHSGQAGTAGRHGVADERTDTTTGTPAPAPAAAGTAAAGTAAAGAATTDRDRVEADRAGVVGETGRDTVAGTARTTDTADAAGTAPAADTTRDGAEGIVRHEEQLDVGTEQREVGTVRLRKYVTEEQQSVDVPVTREEVRVERRPVEGKAAVVDGDPIGEAEQEVTLHEEVPVVAKETHAVEEVRLSREQVQDTERVTDTVRKEHVDVDRDGDLRGDGRS